MARIESVYRHHNEGSFTATSGSLACVVSGLSERNLDDIANGHRQTLRTATPDGQHNNRRTGDARFNSNDTPRRVESGNVSLPNSKHHSDGLNVSAAADIVVSAADEIPGQLQLTYPRRIPRRGYSSFFGLPFLSTPTRNERPTPEGGRSESQHNQTQVSGFPLRGGFVAGTGLQGTATMNHTQPTHTEAEPINRRSTTNKRGQLTWQDNKQPIHHPPKSQNAVLRSSEVGHQNGECVAFVLTGRLRFERLTIDSWRSMRAITTHTWRTTKHIRKLKARGDPPRRGSK